MKKYRKFLSLFMALVMFLGVNLPFTNNVQAAVMTEVAADINLTWEQSKKIKDIIAISKREDKNNEVVLSWDYGEVAGNAYNGDYLFTYNPEDGKEIQIIITKGDGITKISYRVKNLITDKFEEGSLAAYDEKGEKAVYYLYDETDKNWKQEEASSNIWQNAETDGYKESDNIFSAPAGVKVEAFTGYGSVASAVYGADITLNKDTAVAFKYNGNLITAKWQAGSSDGKIYLGLENIDSNKIYNFNVHCEKGTEKYNEYIQVLRALDFKIQPYAQLVIDKTAEPDNYPGREQELKVEIALPQVWDEVTKTYSDTKKYKDDRGYEGLNSNLILKVSETTTKSINFIIDNIYEENSAPKSIGTIELQAGKLDDASSYIVTKGGKRYYSFKISGDGLDPSILYHSHSMTVGAIYNGSGSATELSRLKTTNYKIDKEIPHTYLKYDSITQSDGQRVLMVTPYNANGSYYVHRSTSPDALEGEDSRIAKYEYSVLGGTNTIIIPISNTNNYYYRIEFEYEMGSIFSQILLDNPDGSEYLKTPVLEIPTYKIITETSTQNTIEKVRVVLKWQAGNTAVLKKILDRGQPVTYTFLKTPFSAREGAYAEFLKVEIEKKGENDFGVKLITDDASMNQEVKLLDKWGEYETGHLTSTSVTEEGKEVIESNFTIVLEYEIHNEENLSVRDEPSKIFYYPSIYYVKMRGSYFDVDNIQFYTPYCTPVNITLDANAKALLSPPQEVKVTDVTAKTFKVQWDTMGEELYGDYLEANNCELQENGVQANLFITEKNVINTESSQQLDYFDDEKNRENIVNIPFSSILTGETDDNGNRILDLSNYISDLRAGKMLKITGITQESNEEGTDVNTQVLKITGLDKNTIYYTAMSTLLKVINKLDDTTEDRISDSISTIISFTTKKEDVLDGPNPDEVPPVSPSDFRVDKDAEVTPTKVTLIWSEIEDTPSINSVEIKKEYQLVRTEIKVDEKLLSKRNEFEEFYEEDLSELSETQKRAWRTDSLVKQPENLYLYDDETKVFKVLESNEDYAYEYEKRNPTLEFVDYTLMPNRIYYYYIRTVRMAKNQTTGEWEDLAFSSWEPLTYTTQPVTAPIGLKLERNETYFKYDKETEAVVSFFAAIPAGTTMEEIANLYPLEYAIMKDGEEWQIGTMEVTDSKVFKDGNEEKEGYRHFVYKITGLEQGKGYTVKVRMKARINDESEEVALYDVSLYSNTVQFRTNMNQEDYDTEVKTNKWLELFDEKVMELSQKNYWLIENSSKNYEVIYRTNTFAGELQKAISSIYNFEAENQSRQVYYIPSLALENMNDAGIGVMLSKDGMQATIRANSIDVNDTQAIKDVLEDINAKDARDYYVRIEATWSTVEKINNLEALSEQLELEMDVISTKDMEKTLDAKFVKMFEKAIRGSSSQTEVRRELAEDIENAIKDGDSNEILYQLVMEAVDEVYEEIMDDIDDEFDDNTEDYYSIDTLQKNIIITDEISSNNTVSGYVKNGTLWNAIDTNSYSNKKSFEINKLGVFIFAGKEINIPDVNGIEASESVKNLIAKYGLDDYLGKDIIDTNADATRYMAIGCTARIAGASSTQNETAYLKSKGIKASSAKLYNDITNQEAIYFVMALYEIKTGTKVETIRITNYNNSEFLNGVDSAYKKSVQAAIQLGIFDDVSIGANDSISIAVYLDYLGKLDNKINLK